MNTKLFLEFLLVNGLATEDTIIGCCDREIELIEAAQGVKAPAFYREWLTAAGKCAGVISYDNASFPEMVSFKSKAEYLLRVVEKERIVLPTSAFVFCLPSGEEIQYFDCNAGEDSEHNINAETVYYYSVDNECIVPWKNFWEMLLVDTTYYIDSASNGRGVISDRIELARGRAASLQKRGYL